MEAVQEDDSVSLLESNDSSRDSDLDVFDSVSEDSDWEPSPQAKKDKKKNAKIVQEEAWTKNRNLSKKQVNHKY